MNRVKELLEIIFTLPEEEREEVERGMKERKEEIRGLKLKDSEKRGQTGQTSAKPKRWEEILFPEQTITEQVRRRKAKRKRWEEILFGKN